MFNDNTILIKILPIVRDYNLKKDYQVSVLVIKRQLQTYEKKMELGDTWFAFKL